MNPSPSAYHKAYVSRGWHLFPIYPIDEGRCACGNSACGSPGKHPIGTLVPHGHADATTDVRILAEWWAEWPDAHIGIRTGAISGIVVLDIDAGKGGWDSLTALEDEHGATPDTPTVATGGGGAHAYFRHPGRLVSNSAGTIAPGIDVRGDGGYVVAPPSGHASGTPYAWPDGLSPADVPLANPPVWLIPEQSSRRESPRLTADELLTEGGRNNRLMRIGAAWRGQGLNEAEIAAALHIVNRTRCRPPLEEAEVGRIAASVARYEPNRKGGILTFGKRKSRISIVGGQVVAS